MGSILSRFIRLVVINLSGAFLFGGCAMDIGSYPHVQSMEASVQAVLAQQGYYRGPIDGSIGPTTSRAIGNYQQDHRLTPTGTINPALVASMGLSVPQPTAVSSFSTGYPSYYTPYPPAIYNAPPAFIGAGGAWPYAGYGSFWNRGWGGGAPVNGGYNHWGNYGYCNSGSGHRNQGDNDHDKDHKKHKKHDHKKHGDRD